MAVSRVSQFTRLSRCFHRDASTLLKPTSPRVIDLPEFETKLPRFLKTDFLKIEPITDDDFEEVVNFAAEASLKREALHAGAGVTYQDFMSYFPRILSEILPEGLSYAAWDTRTHTLAGIICSEIDYPGKHHGFSGLLSWCKNKKVRSIISAVSSIAKDEDFFKQFHTDRLLRLHFGRISKDYDRMGVINQFIHDTMEEGERKKAGATIGEVTNWRLVKLMRRIGFEKIRFNRYEEMMDNGQQVFDVSKMNGSKGLTLMVKRM